MSLVISRDGNRIFVYLVTCGNPRWAAPDRFRRSSTVRGTQEPQRPKGRSPEIKCGIQLTTRLQMRNTYMMENDSAFLISLFGSPRRSVWNQQNRDALHSLRMSVRTRIIMSTPGSYRVKREQVCRGTVVALHDRSMNTKYPALSFQFQATSFEIRHWYGLTRVCRLTEVS